MTDAVLVDIAGGVATLTLNRPDNRNAMSVELVDALGAAIDAAIADDAARTIVLTHVGTTFCAGADLKAGGPGTGTYTLDGILATMLDSPTPIVGRIAGHCAGGGVGLAAACDISVIDEAAKVAFSEVRIGVAPAMISVVCLPKLRAGDARELFLRGNRITGARAVEVGLYNHAVPADGIDARVDEIVADLVRGGPNALAAAKRLLSPPVSGRDEWFAWTAELSAALFASPEAQEGMASFREKRDAAWVPTD